MMRLAVCAMIRNEAPYLLEWLAFHSLCGVELFRLYDDDSDDGTAALLVAAARHFPIERIAWRQPGRTRQVAAFDDALAALRGRVDFAACIDADEFLFDPLFRPLPRLLGELPADVGAVAVNQRVFGSSGQLASDGDLVTRRFLRRAPTQYHEHRWFKSIVRPDCALGFETCHNATLRDGRYVLADGTEFQRSAGHPGQADRIAASGPVLHHYIVKSQQEFRDKQLRGAVSDDAGARHIRLTDAYFAQRDAGTNMEADTTLLALADRVAARMADAARTAPARPPHPPRRLFAPALGCAAGIDEIPDGEGLCPPDGSNIAWVKPFQQARIRFQPPAGSTRLQMRCYRVTPDYPIEDIAIFLDAGSVAFTTQAEDANWFSIETETLDMGDTPSLLAIAPPFFIPARHLDRSTADDRYLAIAVAELRFVG